MDFSTEEYAYTEEQEEFAREVRAWLGENLPDITRRRDVRKITHEEFLKRREFARRLGEKGWLAATAPTRYGGGGLDADHAAVISIELGNEGLGVRPFYDSTPLATAGISACATEEQKQRYLTALNTGSTIWQLFTEPEAGTDEANQQTNALRAQRQGEYFIINGQKIFVGGLYAPPDLFLLLTRSDLEADRHENLAMFVAPADLEGVTIQPLDLFATENYSGTTGRIGGGPGVKHTVFFDDVKVHESCLIGEDHDGWRVATATLAAEHGEVARDDSARAPARRGGRRVAGIGRNYSVDRLLDRCKNDPDVANRLRENPQLMSTLVDIFVDAEKQRLFSIRNAGGRGGRSGGPRLQLYGKQLGNKVIAQIAQILGPYVFTDDDQWGLDDGLYEVGQRSGVITSPAGTPEALKIVIGRGLAIGR